MMGELASYQVRDFMLFSQEVYLATIKNYNQEIWPTQLFWLMASVVLLYSVNLRHRKRSFGRFASVIMASAWLWIGGVFHYQYFMPINWAAKYFAWLCFAESALILWVGVIRGKLQFQQSQPMIRGVGMIILVISLFIPVELLWSFSFKQVQLFGWGADRTALATVGALLLCRFSWSKVLVFLPAALWCVIAGMMHLGLVGS